MTVQKELETVTEEIATARNALAAAEVVRLQRRRLVAQAEANLQTARIALMSRHDAGSNDTARRAYAERETTNERGALTEREIELMETEIEIIEITADLRNAEDRRRYLETVIWLQTTGAAESLHQFYADTAAGLPF